MNDIQQKTRALIAGQLSVPVEQVTDTARLVEDLQADSLDLVELTMMLEEAFGVEVTDDQADQLVTVGDIFKFVSQAESTEPM